MKAVIQRIKEAKVKVNGKTVGEAKRGYLVFLGIGVNDGENEVEYMVSKVANLRIMADSQDKMNLNLKDAGGEILVVSQFTLYGDTKGQNRPSFIGAAKPERAEELYNLFIEKLKKQGLKVESGKFATMMEVELVNDGPVTIIIESQ